MKNQKAWVLAYLCVAGLACAATAQNTGWKEYSYTADGFAIKAPAEPALSKQAQATATGTVEVHNYAIEMGNNSGMMISVAEIQGAENTPAKDLLQRAKNGAIQAVKATLSSEKEITFAGHQGVEFEAANDSFHMRCRMFVVKSKLVTMMAIAPVGTSIPADSTRIFDSLRFL